MQLAEIYRVRAQAELTLERPWNAVKSLIAREKYIVAADEIARNQRQLWHVLETQSRTQLKAQRDASQDPLLNGWLDLAITVLDNSYGTHRLGIAIDEWKKSHPQHPASAAFLQTLARPVPSVIGRIDRIALLLPLTSEYAQAAGAVRDGFMAMDANNPNPEKMFTVCPVISNARMPKGIASGSVNRMVTGWMNDSNWAAKTMYMKTNDNTKASMK